VGAVPPIPTGVPPAPSADGAPAAARRATLAAVTAHHRLGRRLATPHLPQGAPTSPALANLVAHRLDRRLAGLARSVGATYSRYADDLVLSGDRELQRRLRATRAAVAAIVADEGFVLHPEKSQLMHRAGRQRVCGMVVNVAPNLAREEFDRLRAILHDAATHGPERANRAGLPNFRAHLTGRVAWAASLNPARGVRLRAQLAAIDPWPHTVP
jgi:RNA-directed DNA polymerase